MTSSSNIGEESGHYYKSLKELPCFQRQREMGERLRILAAMDTLPELGELALPNCPGVQATERREAVEEYLTQEQWNQCYNLGELDPTLQLRHNLNLMGVCLITASDLYLNYGWTDCTEWHPACLWLTKAKTWDEVAWTFLSVLRCKMGRPNWSPMQELACCVVGMVYPHEHWSLCSRHSSTLSEYELRQRVDYWNNFVSSKGPFVKEEIKIYTL
ncbi:protein ORF143 [Cyprinid herpesvirus 1]|uniref:Protein ORF143 n=1 Tax=Cyprinid herpesvirus 1 TaxID=317858 RepID=K7PCL8_9VIRU|nr:protein ORF143 [Cyprinid herpesvirus 1]AFJ20430.1 protein ORF143 [Cyprinid herpesvirus 1]